MLNQREATELTFKFFNCSLPLTKDEFKQHFRKAVIRLRPDLANSKVNDDEFIRIKKFYDDLVNQNPSWAFSDGGLKELRTQQGHLLSELGLGVGPFKNGKDCDQCNHKGYVETISTGYERCKWCTYGIAYIQPCNRCKGTGKYTNKKGDATFDCHSCKGSGQHEHYSPVVCVVCNGVGGKEVKTGTVLYGYCYTCQGKGEIEIFNPVIPKGRLTAK